MLLIKKGTASYHNNICAKMDCRAFLGLSGKMLKEESAGALQWGFTLQMIYLRAPELKVTHCQTEELDSSTLSGLNCQQVLKHKDTGEQARPDYFFILIEERKVFLKSLRYKSKPREDDIITPQRILCMCSPLLQRNIIH